MFCACVFVDVCVISVPDMCMCARACVHVFVCWNVMNINDWLASLKISTQKNLLKASY